MDPSQCAVNPGLDQLVQCKLYVLTCWLFEIVPVGEGLDLRLLKISKPLFLPDQGLDLIINLIVPLKSDCKEIMIVEDEIEKGLVFGSRQ